MYHSVVRAPTLPAEVCRPLLYRALHPPIPVPVTLLMATQLGGDSAALQGLSHCPRITSSHLAVGSKPIHLELTLIPLGLAWKSLSKRTALN